MPCSIFRPQIPEAPPCDVDLRTGALAMLARQGAHPGLANEDHPPSWWQPLFDGELVTIYAQATDIGGGNVVYLDDGSGPVQVTVTPEHLAELRGCMRSRSPVSLIARTDGHLVCVYLQRSLVRFLIPASEVPGILGRSATRDAARDTLERTRRDDDAEIDTLPPYRETIEWVARGRRAARVRVMVSSDEDGEHVAVERCGSGVLRGDATNAPRHVWLQVSDAAERTALMAEAALRLYARRARHEQNWGAGAGADLHDEAAWAPVASDEAKKDHS